ncbi:MAG: hypothetical protein HY905_12645 [Deltaproteobacteria bacterium]|nr:hypothetical protein [Deltaproteobacteria bacterium]
MGGRPPDRVRAVPARAGSGRGAVNVSAPVRGWRELLRRREALVGINRRNLELVDPHNERRHYPLADDKLLAKNVLAAAGVAVPRTVTVCERVADVPAVLATLGVLDEFVVKPARGSGGDGIVVAVGRASPGVWKLAGGGELAESDLRRHLAEIVFGAYALWGGLGDRALVEERIEPHEFLHGLWPHGLPDVRVITLGGVPFVAMVRVPTSRSGGRANLHQGGVGVAVDVATGRMTRAVLAGEQVERHPDTGRALTGAAVPCWPQIVGLARRASRAVPLGYLGVDIVLDRTGRALVLELNVRPGLEIQNVHGRGLAEFLAEVGP